MNRLVDYLSLVFGNKEANYPGLFRRNEQADNLNYAIIQASSAVLFDVAFEKHSFDFRKI
jgi:hypothetical protein